MATNGKFSNSSRRRDVRRNLPKPPAGWKEFLRQGYVRWAVVYTLGMTLLGGMLIHAADRRATYVVGQVTRTALVPRVQFQAVDEYQTQIRKQNASDREPAIYKHNEAFFVQLRHDLEQLLAIGEDYDNIDQVPLAVRNDWFIDRWTLSQLKQFTRDDKDRQQWTQKVDRFLEGIAGQALLSPERFLIETNQDTRSPMIKIVHPHLGELARAHSEIYSTDKHGRFRKNVTKFATTLFPATVRKAVIAVVMEKLAPTYVIDEKLTVQRRQSAHDRVVPVKTTFLPDMVMTPAGAALSTQDIQLLEMEDNAYRQSLRDQKFVGSVSISTARFVGRVCVLLVICIALWAYLIGFARRVAVNPMRGLALSSLLVGGHGLAIALTGLTAGDPQYFYAMAILPTLLATMILAISYNQRMALALGAVHTLIVMVTLHLPVGFAIVALSGVGVITACLDDVRSRSRLVTVGFFSGLAMAASCFFVSLSDWTWAGGGTGQLWQEPVILLVMGMAAGFLIQGVLPVVEKLFRVTTSMTLRELNDASLPLLRRMAEDAPGTFQHSLRIADMSEAAAEAIGANGLLCRVGAMYHDIGKMNKPMYFVENQGGGPNRHNKLSPAMSLLIIVGHVKDGIEMAREYALPVSLRGFIETHHGTTLVEYFYHAAKQQKEAENAPAPADFEFRYPGPKPQTREQAILMLCDALEGASRTLTEPTPVRLEQLVHAIAMKRLMDGQFDQSTLTLKELHRIEQAITKTLCAIYHARIAYPSEANATSDQAKTSPASAVS